MCGRFTQSVSLTSVADKYRIAAEPLGHDLKSLLDHYDGTSVRNYNLAPSESALLIHSHSARRHLAAARFGIELSFGPSKATKLIINARAETALEKSSFTRASRHSRAVVPANGYFEWMAARSTAAKTPYFIRPHNNEISSLGALCFEDKKSNKLSFVILTQAASAPLAAIHDRMPVFVADDILSAWLNEELSDPEETFSLLEAAQESTQATQFEFHEVTKAVGSPTFKSHEAIEATRG